MAKTTVLACDVCGAWDSEETPVRRVTVAGPKFELCAEDRARLLVTVGVPADVAIEYQRMINDKVGKTGALPPLSAAVDALRAAPGAGGVVLSLAEEAANAVVAQAHNSDQAEPELTPDVWEGQDVPQGDPNGDPDQTDILTALADTDTHEERMEQVAEAHPVTNDWPSRLATATAEVRAGLRPVDSSAAAQAGTEQDSNETPPKSARRRK